MVCDQPTATTELEKFQAVDAGNGKINLIGGGGKFCGVRDGSWAKIQCDHDTAEGTADEFRVVSSDDRIGAFGSTKRGFGLKNEKNGKYCSSFFHQIGGWQGKKKGAIYCHRPSFSAHSDSLRIARLDGLPVDAVEPCIGLPACKAGGRSSTLDADTVSPGAPTKHVRLGCFVRYLGVLI